jgi:hypothetical protein
MRELAITLLYKGVLEMSQIEEIKQKLIKHYGTNRVIVMSSETFDKSDLLITEIYL